MLHANWLETSLYLWGLSDGGAPLSSADLRAQLGEISSEPLLASAAIETNLRLGLPGQPPALPQSDDGTIQTIADLVITTVPALRFSAAEAVDLLISLPTGRPDGCGASIEFFARLAGYVIDHLAKQQFYPDVQRNQQGGYEAFWRLLIGGQDELVELQEFAASMPSNIRALMPTAESAGSFDASVASATVAQIANDPLRIVDSFLAGAADAIIRRDVSIDPFFSTVHDRAAEAGAGMDVQWLAALLGPDRRLHASDERITGFLDSMRGWIARLDSGASIPMRLFFRLEEPPENSGVWTLRLAVQLADEDETVIQAEELWQQRGPTAGALSRNILYRQQQFISELNRAAETFELLRALANEPQPTRLELSTIQAHAFIRQYGPALEEQSFGIVLPEWVTRRDLELGLLLSVSPTDQFAPNLQQPSAGMDAFAAGDNRFGLQSLLDFDWQIALGDMKLTAADLDSLLARNSPLVQFGGRWLQIDPDAARRAMQFIDKQKQGKITLAQALRTAYGATRDEAGLPVIGLVGSDWIDQLLNSAPGARLIELPQPDQLQGELRPYQLKGLQWLAFLQRLGLGACLADDMGLGKTIQLIALLLHERQGSAKDEGGRMKDENKDQIRNPKPEISNNSKIQNPKSEINSPFIPHPSSFISPGPTLLFAPMSVVGNWNREIQRFAPALRVLIHHGPNRLSGKKFVQAAQNSDVVITTYALAHRDLDELQKVHWHRLALDEAQKIKNPAAAATVAIRSLSALQRVALTGTPIENHLSELWSIMEVLNPGLLGNASEFRERFAVPVEKLQDTERAQQLRKLVQPFVLRRTKTDPVIAGDLPDKIEMKVYCNLTAEQAAVYQQITSEMLGQIDAATGIRRRGMILAALTRLKQICDHPMLLQKDRLESAQPRQLIGRSGKCERIIEMLEELLEEGDAALIFTQYRQMGHLLEKLILHRLKAPTLFLHGGTPSKKRDEMIQRFQDPKGDAKIFILSLRAGGLGLNLTAANHVFHFDRWWNPAVESQATDRAYRIGQTRKVQVHKFVCVGTMEEKIDKLLSDKIALADQIVSAGDDWLTSMSTQQLKEYLTLGNDAVAEE